MPGAALAQTVYRSARELAGADAERGNAGELGAGERAGRAEEVSALRCDRCGVVADGPIARQLAVIPLAEPMCSCGGRMRPHRAATAADAMLFGGLAWLVGEAFDLPSVAKIGELVFTAGVALSRNTRADGELDRDTKRLAQAHAKLDRDDPTLN